MANDLHSKMLIEPWKSV